MKRSIVLIICIIFCLSGYSQNKKAKTNNVAANSDYWVQQKNYYLLTAIEKDNDVNKILITDPEFVNLTQKKLRELRSSITDCKNPGCFIEAVKFTDDDIKMASKRFAILYKENKALESLIKNNLIRSGTYSLYNNLPPAELLVKAWEQDARAINYTIDVYAGGKKPNYPLIDSISYNVNSKGYINLLYDVSATLIGDIKNTGLFFEPALRAALLYLQINERYNAADYEPMALTVNKPAVDYIKTIKWAKYAYTNILVPGAGPDNLTTPLSGEGMLRCRLAAQQYRLGVAPLIMVSGGKAHPFKTKYCEAVEMKDYLIKILNIPAKAIIIEPHARHTTTNLRNCARLIYKYGIPDKKAGIIITDKSQTDFIMGMDKRCTKELGYVPYKLATRLSDTGVEYFPLPGSQADRP